MRGPVVLVLVLLLAGCGDPPSAAQDNEAEASTGAQGVASHGSASATAGPGPAATSAPSNAPAGNSSLEASAPSGSSAQPVLHVVLDVNQSFTNPIPPQVPGVDNNEWNVAALDLGVGYSNLTFEWTRIHDTPRAFADNCRLWRGDELVDQAAFSDAQVGVIASEGTCILEFGDLEPGKYNANYLSDGLVPTGTHQVRLRVTGWLTAPV